MMYQNTVLMQNLQEMCHRLYVTCCFLAFIKGRKTYNRIHFCLQRAAKRGNFLTSVLLWVLHSLALCREFATSLRSVETSLTVTSRLKDYIKELHVLWREWWQKIKPVRTHQEQRIISLRRNVEQLKGQLHILRLISSIPFFVTRLVRKSDLEITWKWK